MALWSNTDALASTPKYVARKAFFDSTAVSTSAETINIIGSNTGFATGDAVSYSINGGTVIGGLVDGTTYFVRVVGAALIELYNTYANATAASGTTGRLNITGAGVGTHTLQRTGAANAAAGQPGIFFVDAQEAQATANKAKGITGAGWWLYRTYTDAQSATRHKAECLIALAASAAAAGDAEDTVAVDLAITIGTQPADTTVDLSDSTTDTATFTVVASVNGAVPLSYQWQKQEAGAGAWTNISGATSDSFTTGVLTVVADNTDKYRVIVSADAISATSDAATLTVQA
jgi:hypothetical protein